MKQITASAVGAMAAVLLVTGTVAARSVSTPQTHPVVATRSLAVSPIGLVSRPGSPEDRIARYLTAQDIAKSRRGGDNPLVLVASARLAGSDVLFVQLQSTRECGSAGCDTVSFKKTHGRWVKILDTVGGTIRISDSHHNGMPDLIVKDTNRLIWDGVRYV
jgi:hypothetical protein